MTRSRVGLTLVLVLGIAGSAGAQSRYTYTLFSTGVDAGTSGTVAVAHGFPAHVRYEGFFDHQESDKTYVESTIRIADALGFSGVYEIQDQALSPVAQLAGVGYSRDIHGWQLAGKYFPFTSDEGRDFAGEITLARTWGAWELSGFVDVGHGDQTTWFSKSQAVRPVVPFVDFIGEYRWSRADHRTDRGVWFGLAVGR